MRKLKSGLLMVGTALFIFLVVAPVPDVWGGGGGGSTKTSPCHETKAKATVKLNISSGVPAFSMKINGTAYVHSGGIFDKRKGFDGITNAWGTAFWKNYSGTGSSSWRISATPGCLTGLRAEVKTNGGGNVIASSDIGTGAGAKCYSNYNGDTNTTARTISGTAQVDVYVAPGSYGNAGKAVIGVRTTCSFRSINRTKSMSR
ncbi:MAG: hypothetical protein IID18_03985 [Nitrospinae bacterium]|nr:hypothetical protein [Nitrospinota bacterium]